MWFNGPIAKAVEKTRAEKTMLLVFVCGNDENSILMQKNLEDNIFQDVYQKENCVALKLEDKSEATKQFTEFYPLNNVPTVYFIGSNGKSLEVISDLATIDQIRESFSKALQSHEHLKSGQLPTTSTGGVPYANVENDSQNVLEEKLALAQELIKQKREEKAKQDEEDEKAKEVKRREEGKMVNKAREQHRDQEILAAAAERKRDKKNDKEHLDKIRQQIAADRAEKSQSYQAQKNVELQTKKEHLEKQSQEDAEKARLEQLDRCKRARIQFRLPDGSTFNETFDAKLPFSDAVRFAENRVPSLAPFQLIQMFPRREFTDEEIAKSFKDLQLVPSIVLMILPEKGLFESLKIHPETALRYFNRVENSYHYTNPYHNNKHAADVAQTINVLMSAERLKNVFTDLEKFAAIFAASTHDVDHPGFTSQYLIETNSEISIKFHDDAVLEHHHLETGFKLLQEPGSDILTGLSKKDKDTFRHIVNRMILSTDNSRQSEVLNKFKALVINKQSNPLVLNANERIIALSAMIHLADVSNPTKPLKLYQEWSNRVMSEFFRQGDSERRLGLQVTQNFDRNTTDVHKVQIGFINFIEPFWVAWSDFVPEGKVYLNQMKENKEYEKRHFATI